MENAWQLFVRKLSSDEIEFTYDEVSDWTAEEFDALTAAGLLSEVGPASHVICDSCEESHWEQVLWSEDRKTAFIPCKASAPIDVDPARLRVWRADLSRFVSLLAQSLSLKGAVRALPAKRLWHLGRGRIGNHRPYYFFGAVPSENVKSALEAIRHAYGRIRGVLFLPTSAAANDADFKLKPIDLSLAAIISDGKLVMDAEVVEDQFSDGVSQPGGSSKSKKASSPLVAHRHTILRAAITTLELDGTDELARHLGVSTTALHGMVRGDKPRYGDDTLASVLKKLGCPRAKWDRVSKSPGRQ
jgi:hypothetical protein